MSGNSKVRLARFAMSALRSGQSTLEWPADWVHPAAMCVFTPVYKGIHLHFPARLVALRQAQRMTVERLAEKAAMDLLKIQRLESGYAKPAFEDVRRIADALDVGVTALLGLTNC